MMGGEQDDGLVRVPRPEARLGVFRRKRKRHPVFTISANLLAAPLSPTNPRAKTNTNTSEATESKHISPTILHSLLVGGLLGS